MGRRLILLLAAVATMVVVAAGVALAENLVGTNNGENCSAVGPGPSPGTDNITLAGGDDTCNGQGGTDTIHGDSGADTRALTWAEHRGLGRVEVKARVARVRARRKASVVAQSGDP